VKQTLAPRCSLILLAIVAVVCTANRGWGIGFILAQTKEELKLQYDVTVTHHVYQNAPTGRVTIVLTLADEGRLAPLDEVELTVPGQVINADGGRWMDLVVSVEMKPTVGGKRVGRVHILKELAQRAEIRLNTHTMDGKPDPMTRLHHVIPIAKYMDNAPPPAKLPAPADTSPAPPATPQRKN
jgi:hypothetical protein